MQWESGRFGARAGSPVPNVLRLASISSASVSARGTVDKLGRRWSTGQLIRLMATDPAPIRSTTLSRSSWRMRLGLAYSVFFNNTWRSRFLDIGAERTGIWQMEAGSWRTRLLRGLWANAGASE